MLTVYDVSNHLLVIQALMVLCIWQLPYGATDDDPAWMFCGIATHKALKMGLHRPFSSKMEFDYFMSRDKEVKVARQNTWATCFIVNQL